MVAAALGFALTLASGATGQTSGAEASGVPAAAPAAPEPDPPPTEPGAEQDDDDQRLVWRPEWKRVGRQELVLTGALAGAALTMELADDPGVARWSGPVLFDEPLRRTLTARSRADRDAAARASDVLLYTGIAHPVLVDNLLITWLGRGSSDVAGQMFVINAQSYAITLFATVLLKQTTARRRPYVPECDRDPGYSENCESTKSFRSFPSGHASLTATGAGLMCAHHTNLSLYGSDVLDTGTCVFAIVGTTATGALRLASDVHYASDVLVGHLIGYVSGYFVPTLVHYGAFRIAPSRLPVTAALLPFGSGDAAGLQLVGAW